MSGFFNKLSLFQTEITTAIGQTALMMLISMAVALILGLPMGTLIYLNRINYFKKGIMITISRLTEFYVNVIRSFPFLLFVVAIIPFTRLIIGTSFGTFAAAVPLAFVAVGHYARMVEQSLLDVPMETVELAKSLGATTNQLIINFLFVEARSSLVLSFTTVMIGMISYSTIMGVVGGGGIGDFAIRYGYQSYEYELMYTTIILMIIGVIVIQTIGSFIAGKIDKRKMNRGKL